MTKSTILITPTTNIKNNTVVDNNKIEKRIYNSHKDSLTFLNKNTNKTRRSNLMDVSLYDDLILIGDTQYVILHMLTKNEEVNYGACV